MRWWWNASQVKWIILTVLIAMGTSRINVTAQNYCSPESVGLQNGDHQLSASSSAESRPDNARYDSVQPAGSPQISCWQPASTDLMAWIQVDFDQMYDIWSIQFQECGGSESGTTNVLLNNVEYSLNSNGDNFITFLDPNGLDFGPVTIDSLQFEGGLATPVEFWKPIVAHRLRLNVRVGSRFRFEVLGCILNSTNWYCDDGNIDIEDSDNLVCPYPVTAVLGELDRSSYAADSESEGNEGWRASFSESGGWRPASSDTQTSCLRISFPYRMRVEGIIGKFDGQENLADLFYFQASYDGSFWSLNRIIVFGSDITGCTRRTYFEFPILALQVRVCWISSSSTFSSKLSVEILGCLNNECLTPLRINQKKTIMNSLTTSSGDQDDQHFTPNSATDILGRLGLGWIPSSSDENQWFEVVLGNPHIVYAIILQGCSFEEKWVMSYKIGYQMPLMIYMEYEYDAENYVVIPTEQVFEGSVDNNSFSRNVLPYSILTNVLRIIPVTWHNGICLKLDLIGGEPQDCIMPIEPISLDQVSATRDEEGYSANDVFTTCWYTENPLDWLQIDLFYDYLIAAIDFRQTDRSGPGEAFYSTAYHISYVSSIQESWKLYIDSNGNQNITEYNYMELDHPFTANKIRIFIDGGCMRINNIYGFPVNGVKLPVYCDISSEMDQQMGMEMDDQVSKFYNDCPFPIGLETGKIGDHQISASSFIDGAHSPNSGRLNHYHGWQAGITNREQWFQIDFDQRMIITGLIIQGSDRCNVEKFILKYGYPPEENESITFYDYVDQSNNVEEFMLSDGANCTKIFRLNPYIHANSIQINPIEWFNCIGLRIEALGCKDKDGCPSTAGLSSGDIPDTSLTASSTADVEHVPSAVRLSSLSYSVTCWSPLRTDNQAWFTVKIPPSSVYGIVMRGCESNLWVERFTLSYVAYESDETDVLDTRGFIKEFSANINSYDLAYIELETPLINIEALTIHPIQWSDGIGMTFELIACQYEPCAERLGLESGAITDEQIEIGWSGTTYAGSLRLYGDVSDLKGMKSSLVYGYYKISLLDLYSIRGTITRTVVSVLSEPVMFWIAYRYTNETLTYQTIDGKTEMFVGGELQFVEVTNLLDRPIITSEITFYTYDGEGLSSLQFEVLGCSLSDAGPMCTGNDRVTNDGFCFGTVESSAATACHEIFYPEAEPAIIRSEAETDFIRRYTDRFQRAAYSLFIIGANGNMDGDLVWRDSTPVLYNNFMEQPDHIGENECVAVDGLDRQDWTLFDCEDNLSTTRATLCQADLDECIQRDICSFDCVNTPGSYYCICQPGYYIGNDGSTCDDGCRILNDGAEVEWSPVTGPLDLGGSMCYTIVNVTNEVDASRMCSQLDAELADSSVAELFPIILCMQIDMNVHVKFIFRMFFRKIVLRKPLNTEGPAICVDSLTINDINRDNNVLAEICDSFEELTLLSRSNKISLILGIGELTSNVPLSIGFEVFYSEQDCIRTRNRKKKITKIDCNQEPCDYGCGVESVYTARSGRLSTLNYPEPVRDFANCDFVIQVEKGKYIEIEFQNFGIASNGDGSCKDSLEVLDTVYGRATLTGRRCGTIMPTVRSATYAVVIVVKTGSGGESRGFEATYRTVDIPGCDFGVQQCSRNNDCNSTSAMIASINYPYSYEPSCVNEWEINVRLGSYIKFEILDIDLRSGNECKEDFLRFSIRESNADVNDDAVMPQICKPLPDNVIFAPSNYLRVLFDSNAKDEGTGFLARYTEQTFEPELINKNITGSCPSGWKKYNAQCYAFQTADKMIDWNTAHSNCVAIGGTLASISTYDEMQYIHSILITKPDVIGQYVYIGLMRENFGSQLFRWNDGRPASYMDWYQSSTYLQDEVEYRQPEISNIESCTTIGMASVAETDQWLVVACSFEITRYYVCETPLPGYENMDSVVLKVPTVIDDSPCKSDHQFQCSFLDCIAAAFVCDGIIDCFDGSDEAECNFEVCPEGYTRIGPNCISLSLVCDGRNDVRNGGDEIGCGYVRCSNSEFRCENGKCVNETVVCNGVNDCAEGEDESDCLNCAPGFFQCHDGSCIPMHAVCDGAKDCGGRNYEDEEEGICDVQSDTNDTDCLERGIPCNNGACVSTNYQCLYDIDQYGIQVGCRDATHLRFCEDFQCPDYMFKCPDSYCIPMRRRCDSVWDCPNGEDEKDCSSYSCANYYHCRASSQCISPQEVCDGVRNCPSGDDEQFCDISCPSSCTCSGFVVKCSSTITTADLELLPTSVRYLDLSSNLPTASTEGRAKRTVIDDFLLILNRFPFLHTLDLSNNSIEVLFPGQFSSLVNLRKLNLSRNAIDFLEDQTFEGLKNLSILDLSYNGLEKIDRYVFMDINNTKQLYIEGNDITDVDLDTFIYLELDVLESDDYMFCCIATATSCLPEPDEFSSCKDLMRESVLRVFIWILGLSALIGNFCVFLWRLRIKEKNKVQGYLIQNLAVADFFMGVYLLIIASADIHYRDNYVINASAWRGSKLCSFAGFLSVLSSEMSVYILTVITVDRFISIVFPFSRFKMRSRGAIRVLAIGWILVFLVSIIPAINSEYFDQYYGINAVCLALPITHQELPAPAYSIFFFLGVNMVSFIIIAVCYTTMYIRVKQSAAKLKDNVIKNDSKKKELKMATKMAVIVLTDMCCWLPIIIMGILARSGAIEIPGDVYAWTAVFLLPLNSAINPHLYTVSSYITLEKKKKKKVTSKVTGSTPLSTPQPMKKLNNIPMWVVPENVQRKRQLLPYLRESSSQAVTIATRLKESEGGGVKDEELALIEKKYLEAINIIRNCQKGPSNFIKDEKPTFENVKPPTEDYLLKTVEDDFCTDDEADNIIKGDTEDIIIKVDEEDASKCDEDDIRKGDEGDASKSNEDNESKTNEEGVMIENNEDTADTTF
ncbi:uncharacterized protein LOC117120284 [Anneissia japonica]|uniref:uncharacterized protein LOC117120284 n=1 Tax=Anneissia japonica TaxID=1529436 RepID=UPI0014257587|nr:uncharacterized protein LOC117120284 [Anneissia japonica]